MTADHALQIIVFTALCVCAMLLLLLTIFIQRHWKQLVMAEHARARRIQHLRESANRAYEEEYEKESESERLTGVGRAG